MNTAIQQILDDTIETQGLVDILGLEGSGRSIFDPAFLARIQDVKDKNSAHAALEDLIRGELRDMRKKFLIQSKKFSAMLENTLDRYRKSEEMDVQEALDSMFALVEQMKAAQERGEELDLTESELAFFDALETNEASVRAMGSDKLGNIARMVAEAVQELAKDDWLISKRKQDRLRVKIRDILEDEGYPEDKAKEATDTVLEQARLTAVAQSEEDI
jgi:type I restriction enzyme R subunit